MYVRSKGRRGVPKKSKTCVKAEYDRKRTKGDGGSFVNIRIMLV